MEETAWKKPCRGSARPMLLARPPMRFLRSSLPFAFLICFLLASAAHAQENTGRAQLFGRITSAETGEPFPGASVAVLALERDPSAGAGPVQPRLTVGVESFFDNAYRSFLDTYKGYTPSPGRNVFVPSGSITLVL